MTAAPESPGVYLITNTKTNKRYVGCSKNIKQRWAWHRHHLKKNQHHNEHLQRSHNKYGPDVFVYTVLELTDLQTRFEREDYYIQLLKPEYNVCKNPHISPDKWLPQEATKPFKKKEKIVRPWDGFAKRMWLTEDEIINYIDEGLPVEESCSYLLNRLSTTERGILNLFLDRIMGRKPDRQIKAACKRIGLPFDRFLAISSELWDECTGYPTTLH